MKLKTVLACLAAAVAVAAQTPNFRNARVTVVNEGLEAALASAKASGAVSWVGYAEAAVTGMRANCGVAYLEDGARTQRDDAASPAGAIAILIRVEAGKADRVRTDSLPCTLDGGGERVVWLENVSAEASAATLESLAQGDALAARGADAAMGAAAALGMSAGEPAERALQRLAGPEASERTEEQAVFWLASARGHEGFEFLKSLENRQSTGEALRRRLTFAFETSRDPGATGELIQMARHDAAASVRAQAIFWLAQKAGERAVGAISQAVEDDPSTQVKERAVFGLSQLPNGQGVPILIQIARSNANPAIRKRAMFWLGQSRDPRALAFFRQVLSGN